MGTQREEEERRRREVAIGDPDRAWPCLSDARFCCRHGGDGASLCLLFAGMRFASLQKVLSFQRISIVLKRKREKQQVREREQGKTPCPISILASGEE
jgi:hypothetical protein